MDKHLLAAIRAGAIVEAEIVEIEDARADDAWDGGAGAVDVSVLKISG